MFSWIVEADIYRLEKLLRDSTHADERRQLQRLIQRKEALLVAARRNPTRA